jgi:hypothetical protein
MTITPSTLPSAAPLAAEDDIGRAGAPSSDTGSFGGLTGRLEELPDLAVVFADIERALGDLGAAAELTAYAVVDTDRPAGARATQVSPTPAARGVSWRLHGLASALRTSREVCLAVQSAGRELALARQPHGAPLDSPVKRQLRDPSA